MRCDANEPFCLKPAERLHDRDAAHPRRRRQGVHDQPLPGRKPALGDGVADEKKVLVTGLGGGIEHPRGADHTTNGVRMGIDGWLYIAVGDFGAGLLRDNDGAIGLGDKKRLRVIDE